MPLITAGIMFALAFHFGSACADEPWTELTAPEDALDMKASFDEGAIEVGKEFTLKLSVTLKEGWSAGESGIPEPIIQIDTPTSATLAGKALKTHKELASNEFLREPFERVLKGSSGEIRFVLNSKPEDGETISVTVLAYVSQPPNENSWFVRERLEIEVKPSATAISQPSLDSKWAGDTCLQIGDEVAPFTLPQGNGDEISLGDYIGEKNIIVTTYRAFW